ncbi:MAG TPA: response regulator transcription factor [Azospira sp.]|nr:response regulator transcription factor [Azospira sp.]
MNTSTNTPITVLIVEDAPEERALLTHYLGAQAMDVRQAASLSEMEAALQAQVPDIVLLDINLPDGNGLEAAHRLKLGSQTGLIFITVRNEREDRIQGLDQAGGDDYVTKPLDLEELAARIRSVLRRKNKPIEPLNFSGWSLDPVRRELFCPDGCLLPLTAGEFNILWALAARPGEVLNRDFLLDVISNRDPSQVAAHTVDTMVARLRAKMRSRSANGGELIRTLRGRGYSLALG